MLDGRAKLALSAEPTDKIKARISGLLFFILQQLHQLG